ncbi:hypothetical protein BKI52_43695 [marine bacterium AO1-C]|nr:hypothetical protein BKI52_43695 [marine bacterium AO1-C]
MIIGNRIPRSYFITNGAGESDITIHAGSYHLALRDAGIEMANIMTYSSILPGIATEIPKPERHQIIHGSVMESIMAVSHVEKGEQANAGIIFGWLYNKKNNQKYGGLVCEHDGSYGEERLLKNLNDSLEELYVNGFEEDYDLRDTYTITKTFVPKKKHGTALVSLCFTDYIYPVIG